MKRTIRTLLAPTVGLALSVLAVTAALGVVVIDLPTPYQAVSEQHTNWGQSQLLAGILGRDLDSFPMRLYNPTEETMFASILVYTAPRIQEPGNTEDYELDSEANEVFSEVFLGCLNVEITSHGAFELEDDFFFNDLEPNNGPNIINAYDPRPAINPDRARMYVEVVSVPKRTVVAGRVTRLANGLGLAVSNADDQTRLNLHNPQGFSLPRNQVVPGQREAAAECMCEIFRARRTTDPLLWVNFGIRCY